MIMHENDILRHANTAVQMAQTFVNVTKSLKQTGYTLYSLVVTCTKQTPRNELKNVIQLFCKLQIKRLGSLISVAKSWVG
jgi:hypothetical protein